MTKSPLSSKTLTAISNSTTKYSGHKSFKGVVRRTNEGPGKEYRRPRTGIPMSNGFGRITSALAHATIEQLDETIHTRAGDARFE